MDTKPPPGYITQITYTRDGKYKVDYVSAQGVQPGTTCLVRWDFDGPSEILDNNPVPFTPSSHTPKI
jgi:hypothetical protein